MSERFETMHKRRYINTLLLLLVVLVNRPSCQMPWIQHRWLFYRWTCFFIVCTETRLDSAFWASLSLKRTQCSQYVKGYVIPVCVVFLLLVGLHY